MRILGLAIFWLVIFIATFVNTFAKNSIMKAGFL
jgi:hypothetical protein